MLPGSYSILNISNNINNHMDKYRVVELHENTPDGVIPVYWIEILKIKKVGFWNKRTLEEWTTIPSGIWLHGYGWLDFDRKRKYTDKEEAIRYCELLNEPSKSVIVYPKTALNQTP